MKYAKLRLVDIATPERSRSYACGLADGRRTVEAEVAAEREAIAVLANSMGSLVEQLVLVLNPSDIARLEGARFALQIVPEAMVPVGGVRVEGCLS